MELTHDVVKSPRGSKQRALLEEDVAALQETKAKAAALYAIEKEMLRDLTRVEHSKRTVPPAASAASSTDGVVTEEAPLPEIELLPLPENKEVESLYSYLKQSFADADADGNETLDAQELTQVLKALYKYEKTSRSTKEVAREVKPKSKSES